MLGVLADPIYRNLFLAQVLSLIGTGLTTVALALLAYELAGADAGLVLGTALALKMVVYVTVAPVAGAFAAQLPRRGFLVALDLTRAGLVVLLPFVTEVWQVYALVAGFQAFSAAFTPTFQATIPEVLPEEERYTRALSLSRLAYDLESLVSPALAGLLLVFISFHDLFLGTALGFIASAVLVARHALPGARQVERPPLLKRLFRGTWIYWRTPRLKGLLELCFAAACGGSMVIVNSVVFVRTSGAGQTLSHWFGPEASVAVLYGAYGAASMVVALALPRVLEAVPPRPLMLAGALLMAAILEMVGLWESAAGLPAAATLAAWFGLGAGNALVLTPAALLLRRSSHSEDRPALFSAQFSLSHACWLFAYPAAGVLGAHVGLGPTAVFLGLCAAVGAAAALFLWPQADPEVIEHDHPELEHEHLHGDDPHHGPAHGHSHRDAWGEAIAHRHRHRHGSLRHAHAFVIDDHHPTWPRP